MTIVAIAILNESFKNDRKLWSLVEKKALKFVSKSTHLDKDDVVDVL